MKLYPPIDRDAETSNAGVLMARSVRETVMRSAEESERERTLNRATVDAMWSSGLMTHINPREAGGAE
ncbi:MAG: hypothetical protein GWO21_09825, partial [Gammaproteobacteria bacterium]|nr:hypothetical protein [Gammaproteobacteria bacterium]